MLEGECAVLVGKGAIPDQFPRHEFRGVAGSTGIVFGDSPPEISGRAGIFPVGKSDASDDVDIPHRCTDRPSQTEADQMAANEARGGNANDRREYRFSPSSPCGLRRTPRFAKWLSAAA